MPTPYSRRGLHGMYPKLRVREVYPDRIIPRGCPVDGFIMALSHPSAQIINSQVSASELPKLVWRGTRHLVSLVSSLNLINYKLKSLTLSKTSTEAATRSEEVIKGPRSMCHGVQHGRFQYHTSSARSEPLSQHCYV